MMLDTICNMSLQMLESEKIQHAAPDKGKKKKDDKKESGQPQSGKVSSDQFLCFISFFLCITY